MSETSRVSTPPDTTDGHDEHDLPERSRLLVYVLGGLALVSAVVAAVVIVSSGGSTTSPEAPVAPVRAGERSVFVGSAKASATVVVYEDFGSAESRAFDLASRDFLRDEAARGDVRVEYRPVALDGDRGSRALTAWGAVLAQGRPMDALAFKDLLFDQPPGTDAAPADLRALAKKAGVKDAAVLAGVAGADSGWATSATKAATAEGVPTTPTVLLDGKPVSATTPVALADELQRRVLAASPA
jgi:protein-disulfide isomerase